MAAPNNVIPLRAPAQPKAGPPTLNLGSNGAPVAALQKKLAEWGFSPGTPTGTFDAATEEALKALQSKLGVPPTGIYGVDTASAVSRDLQNPASILRANAARLSPLPTGLAPAARAAQPGAAAAPAPKAAPAAPGVPNWIWLGLAAAGLWFFASKAKGGGSVASLTAGEEVGTDYLDQPDDEADHGGHGDDDDEDDAEEPLAEVAPAPRAAPPPRPANEPVEVEVGPGEPLAEVKPKRRRRNRKPMDEATKKMLAARKKAARAAKRAAAAVQ